MIQTLRKIAVIVSLCCIAIFTTSCASIVNGQNQSVSVATPATPGATCSLENNKGKWFVNSTPGSVTVHRSYQDLRIACEKKGYKKTTKNIPSSTKGMAFGNVVFGGVIGAGVDMANGSAYDYPEMIQLDMQRA